MASGSGGDLAAPDGTGGEGWTGVGGEARSKVAIRATEIAASLRYDTVTTGRGVRAAQRLSLGGDTPARAEYRSGAGHSQAVGLPVDLRLIPALRGRVSSNLSITRRTAVSRP